MKTLSSLLFAVAFAATAVASNQINLGCGSQGPLDLLSASAEFRDVIGDSNPANYLGSIYDPKGVVLTPETVSALGCPLFINSDAKPSGKMAKAILAAANKVWEPKAEELAASGAASVDKQIRVYPKTAEVVQPALSKTLAVVVPLVPAKPDNKSVPSAARLQKKPRRQIRSQEVVARIIMDDVATAGARETVALREDLNPPIRRVSETKLTAFWQTIGLVRKVEKRTDEYSHAALIAQKKVEENIAHYNKVLGKKAEWSDDWTQACTTESKDAFFRVQMMRYVEAFDLCKQARQVIITRYEDLEINTVSAFIYCFLIVVIIGALILLIFLVTFHRQLSEWSNAPQRYYDHPRLAFYCRQLTLSIKRLAPKSNSAAEAEPPS